MRRLRVAWTAACASGVITPTTGTSSFLLQLRQRRRGRRVAGVDDELHSLALEIGGDLPRELTDLREGPRPIGQPCVVAEVDEILVGHRDEAFVQDGQAAHPRVEHADRPRIHTAIV